ncbi:uncharacterized protein MONOS_10505 [Monocercomonoides exilis]|uniref:uncharacterized protein n=1 Tax=Monocercomonoides exilis TaxID=2049356 RepID=UPI003559FBAC|nr:hypothetical protein MONOS_10505 [Monocercomonoides exilis]|eukprot:MONOS_10505.1-p1 / transcript=MONOS_10505.1 / gene=MONOS_10505 / organism=Monocercomonoides_exilis_PA203 / gene_product=unspecified product / transcript_product=unspecified product / location=Mono_scaffold00480:32725-33069(+) / protein_length=115 / sequence_SO=supercontig / SO=protein_coding / is_pseudo=false
MEILNEDVQHDTTRAEEDSVYPRKTRHKNDRKSGKEKEKGVWIASGTAIESPIRRAREESLKIVIADVLKGEEITQIQNVHRMPDVRRNVAIGPPKEPLPRRLVNRMSEWKKIG